MGEHISSVNDSIPESGPVKMYCTTLKTFEGDFNHRFQSKRAKVTHICGTVIEGEVDDQYLSGNVKVTSPDSITQTCVYSSDYPLYNFTGRAGDQNDGYYMQGSWNDQKNEKNN